MKNIKQYILAMASFCAIACSNHGQTSGHADDAEANEHEDGQIELSDNEANNFGVIIDVARRAAVGSAVPLSGIVTGNANSDVVVTAAKSGRVHYRSGLHIGMAVARGTALGSINANGIGGGDGDASAASRLKSIEAEIARVRPLAEEGIVSRKDFNALLAQADEQRSVVASAGGSGSVTASVGGVIDEIIAAPGSFVQQGDPLVRLRGNSAGSLYIKVTVPQRLVSQATSASRVRLSDGTFLPRHSMSAGSDAAGAVNAYYGPLSSSTLSPGSAVEAILVTDESACEISVPAESVNEQEGVYTVFVKESSGHYRRVPVEIGRFDGERYEILSGLSPSDSVVCSGTIFVRLAETRANAPQGHTHNH